MLCFVVVMQSFIMNSYEVFIHIHQGCFAGTGAIVRLPQCQWSKSDGYGKISQCITTTKHCKTKTVCIFLGIYCICFLEILWTTLVKQFNIYLTFDLKVSFHLNYNYVIRTCTVVFCTSASLAWLLWCQVFSVDAYLCWKTGRYSIKICFHHVASRLPKNHSRPCINCTLY